MHSHVKTVRLRGEQLVQWLEYHQWHKSKKMTISMMAQTGKNRPQDKESRLPLHFFILLLFFFLSSFFGPSWRIYDHVKIFASTVWYKVLYCLFITCDCGKIKPESIFHFCNTTTVSLVRLDTFFFRSLCFRHHLEALEYSPKKSI